MPCMVSGREIILSGDVGSSGDWWFDEGVGILSADVIMALAQIGPGPITVRINSGGGIAWEGSAIHAALARHDGVVTVIVEGVAASAASIIAMAGRVVIMAPGALLMVHEASGFTVGDAREHQRSLDCLGALNSAMASIYAGKTGRSAADCRAEMAAETWMTPEQAVAKGYADSVEGDTAEAAAAPTAPVDPAPFPYRAYRNAPAPVLALADRKNWPRRLPSAAAPFPPEAGAKGARKPKAEQTPHLDPDAKPAPAELNPAGDPPPAPEGTVTEPKTPDPALNRADAAEIADICNAGNAPTMIASLIREGVTAAVARDRVNTAGQIKDVVALARKGAPHLAVDFADKAISAGRTVDQVKASLFDAMAARSEDPEAEVDHHKRTGAGGSDHNAGTKDGRAKAKARMEAKVARMSPKKEG